MSPATAHTIFVAVAATAAVIWLIGLSFLVASYLRGKAETAQAPEDFSPSEPLPPNCTFGSVDLDGQPATLVDRAAATLVRQNPTGVKILEKTSDRVAYEWVGILQPGLPR